MLSEGADGLTTFRAYGLAENVLADFIERLHVHLRPVYQSDLNLRWLSARSDLLGNFRASKAMLRDLTGTVQVRCVCCEAQTMPSRTLTRASRWRECLVRSSR